MNKNEMTFQYNIAVRENLGNASDAEVELWVKAGEIPDYPDLHDPLPQTEALGEAGTLFDRTVGRVYRGGIRGAAQVLGVLIAAGAKYENFTDGIRTRAENLQTPMPDVTMLPRSRRK
jgi:hypothetical protein